MKRTTRSKLWKGDRPWGGRLEEREDFCLSLLDWVEEANLELFFGDEAGFEGDPRSHQKWVKRGSHPTQPYYGGHIRQNVVGVVSPSTDQLVSLIVPHNDTGVFQVFLDTMVPERSGKQVYLILDNASWHKSKSLNWHHIVPKYLPYTVLTSILLKGYGNTSNLTT